MKRTRKWEYVKQEAARLAGLGMSAAEIARRLDIHKSTVGRWIESGKLTVRDAEAEVKAMSPKPKQTPTEWADSVRGAFDLDATDEQLVILGEQALTVSLDLTVPAHIRMTASGRFQAIVRQLALVTRGEEKPADKPQPAESETEAPRKNPPIDRPPGDPRRLLMAVK